MKRRHNRFAFTLVELLVVIGIIAMLIALLLPALNKARRASRTLKCESNLHMLAQAAIMYSNESKGYILPSGVTGALGTDAWPHLLIAGKYVPRQSIDNVNTAPSNESILVCPSVLQSVGGSIGPTEGVQCTESFAIQPYTAASPIHVYAAWSYGINGASGAFYPCGTISYIGSSSSKNMSQFRKCADVVLMFDGQGAGPTNIAGWRHGTWNSTSPDKFGRVNVSFLDGHVQNFDRTQLPDNLAGTDGSFTNPTPIQLSSRFPFPKWRLDQ